MARFTLPVIFTMEKVRLRYSRLLKEPAQWFALGQFNETFWFS